MKLTEVSIQAVPLERLTPLIGVEAATSLHRAGEEARQLLEGRSVWNVNSTAAGGGVAEMLQPLLAYSRGAGVDARWLVIQGDPEMFRTTKRLHNGLHGSSGDGGSLGEDEHAHYQEVLRANADELLALVRPSDVVILHDPQTAGLARAMHEIGATTIWRCHVGSDTFDQPVVRSWSFLRRYLEGAADAFVYSRAAYVPDWLTDAVHVITPSIDPFSAKNVDMDPATVRAVLAHVGLLQGDPAHDTAFTRRDGSPGRVDHRADIVCCGPAPSPEAPLVTQVSRWDRLKDMEGVMHGFAEHVDGGTDAHLALVGPNVSGVTDDPEGAEVFTECIRAWQELPHAVRSRVQLVCLPMADVEENAAIVNAIQRHAAVVAQKSLAEGFGLTVAEAMWKGRPVVASAVGGIQDQIVDGEHGLLVDDPNDLEAFGGAVQRCLDDPALADRLGQSARSRVTERFLGSHHLMRYSVLLAELLRP